MTNSVNSSLSSGRNDGPILYHDEALSAAQHDMVLTDINHKKLADIGNHHGMPNLSEGGFSASPFPVDGIIYGKNNRLMICLNCQHAEKPTAPIVNVWFLVDTGSNCTFLCEDTVYEMYGPKCNAISYFVAIQDSKSKILCDISHSHFADVNVLGMEAMLKLKVSIESMNAEREYFRLARISTTK
ncbi:uncharacterized protein LOC129573029 isoform X2 [Sitodiplosis mosellana]|nr:uncharacterized protein LOC129573029 isoform X2 [Sitodiplosis mosellana]